MLRSRGGRSETELAFAGLHQLVHHVLDRDDQLPAAQRSALRTALGLDSAGDEPTPLRVGVALLSLLSGIAAEAPLLLVVDDAQWVDSASLDALAFVVPAGHEEPIVLVAGARGDVPPRSLAPMPRLVLAPLTPRGSARLLDTLSGCSAWTRPPGGDLASSREPARSGRAGSRRSRVTERRPKWAAAPLPLTDRLYEVYGASLAALPPATRRALLLAAVADAGDRSVLQVATAQVPPDHWLPAEAAGLVSVDPVVRFRHPLIRAAVYRAASAEERRDAHRVVADLLTDYPDRRAWHLAATSVAPDETVAVALDESALQSSRRGAYIEACRALERAADLSADRDARAQRLVRATEAAMQAGRCRVGQGAHHQGERVDPGPGPVEAQRTAGSRCTRHQPGP